LDGVRVPATSFNGAVDINTCPGADRARRCRDRRRSAAYGSDAVVGVVNFILNKKFEGFKASIQGGIASRGDDASWKATLAAGTSFAGGRGHIEGTFDHYFPMAFTISTSAKTAATRSPMSAAALWLRRHYLLERPFFQSLHRRHHFQCDPRRVPQSSQFHAVPARRYDEARGYGTPTVGSPDYQVGGSGGFFGVLR
jgi:outer membrane receptor protein involved in Fe transport